MSNLSSPALQTHLAENNSEVETSYTPVDHHCPELPGKGNNTYLQSCYDRMADDTAPTPPRICVLCPTGKKVAAELEMVVPTAFFCKTCNVQIYTEYVNCEPCRIIAQDRNNESPNSKTSPEGRKKYNAKKLAAYHAKKLKEAT